MMAARFAWKLFCTLRFMYQLAIARAGGSKTEIVVGISKKNRDSDYYLLISGYSPKGKASPSPTPKEGVTK